MDLLGECLVFIGQVSEANDEWNVRMQGEFATHFLIPRANESCLVDACACPVACCLLSPNAHSVAFFYSMNSAELGTKNYHGVKSAQDVIKRHNPLLTAHSTSTEI